MKPVFIGFRKYFIHHHGTFFGHINIDRFTIATNRYDAVPDGINAAGNHTFGLYFPHIEYAFALANYQQYCSRQVVYHHHKSYYAQRSDDCYYLERNPNPYWNDGIFYWIKHQKI